MTPAPVNDISHPTTNTRGCIQIWSLTPRSLEERDLAKAQMPADVLADYEEDMTRIWCVRWWCVSKAPRCGSSSGCRSAVATRQVTFFSKGSTAEENDRFRAGRRNAYPRSESFRPCSALVNSHFLLYQIRKSCGPRSPRKRRITCLLRLSVCTGIQD